MAISTLSAGTVQAIFPSSLALAPDLRVKHVLVADGYSFDSGLAILITCQDVSSLTYEMHPLDTLVPHNPKKFRLAQDIHPTSNCAYCSGSSKTRQTRRVNGCHVAGIMACDRCLDRGYFIASCMVRSGPNPFGPNRFQPCDDVDIVGTWLPVGHSTLADVEEYGTVAALYRTDVHGCLDVRPFCLSVDKLEPLPPTRGP